MNEKIAVIHVKFTTKGGAEVVCMTVLEALQNDFDVTLISLDKPDLEELNAFCGTEVQNIKVRAPRYVTPAINRSIAALNGLTDGNLGPQLPLKAAVLNRLVNRYVAEFDLVVSTSDEFNFPTPSVQYVHFPQFNHSKQSSVPQLNSHFGTLYDRFCSILAGVTEESIRGSRILTNSSWTGRVIEDIYNMTPEVVYPPVSTDEFNGRPWEERESGFVAIGRIAPDKNILEMIETIKEVRAGGHDVHIHLIGPSAEHNQYYQRRVERAVAQNDFVILEGELEREELVSLVCTHRYGIHGKRNEHFGMTVAEMVAGGVIPFVPDGGGQVDIVKHHDELIYHDSNEAIDKIDSVLTDPILQRELREDLQDVRHRFSRERFQRAIRNAVIEAL